MECLDRKISDWAKLFYSGRMSCKGRDADDVVLNPMAVT
jgi:hypothetical protein